MGEPASERTQGVPSPVATPPGPGERWTILRLILWSARWLSEKGVEQGRLDAEHLLAHALGVKRLQLYLQHERPVPAEELAAFKPLLLRRAAREPLQYIVGRAAFRDLELKVDPRALIPRPETEGLVEVVLEWARRRATGRGEPRSDEGVAVAEEDGREQTSRVLTAADIGTGSGCIALSLVREGPFRRVVATDASMDALGLARENVFALGAEGGVELRAGHLMEPLAGERFDALVSNPPYIAEAERAALEPEVRDHEPAVALFAGGDGLAVIRALVDGAAGHLLPGGLLALELGATQSRQVSALIEATGAFDAPRAHRDLSGRLRVVSATLRTPSGIAGTGGEATASRDPAPA